MFDYKDIQWVRNVKRDGGIDWAYFDEGRQNDEEMILHWSSFYKNQPTQAMVPKIGDIVVLFQKVNVENQVYFTHLLTPADNIERDCKAHNPTHRWGRRMKILAKTKELEKPKNFNLTAVNRGHTYPINLLDKDSNKVDIQKTIWNAFQPFYQKNVCKNSVSEISNTLLIEDLNVAESVEGKWLYTLHRIRERDGNLVRKKKASISNPKCECCGFDFAQAYPNLGDGFIECHHKIPINLGERITRHEDLALVCSNCHRMLHRKNKQNNYYTVEELKDIIVNE